MCVAQFNEHVLPRTYRNFIIESKYTIFDLRITPILTQLNDVSIQWKWYHISAGASGKEIELKINRPYNELKLK